MVYQPASVLSSDVDVAIETRGQYEKRTKNRGILRHDSTIEKSNIRGVKKTPFVINLAFIVSQPVWVLY